MPGSKPKPIAERLEARIDRSGGPEACHIWTGGVGQREQPVTTIGKRTKSARRVAFELATGAEIPPKRWVTVICGVSRCMNPKHLELRAVADNVTRFWAAVDKRGPDECWPWQQHLMKGYGWFHIWEPGHYKEESGMVRTGKSMTAHRFSYELHNGPIEGHVPGDAEREIVVMHTCDNPRCVNPAHLRLGSDADNIHDAIAKGRMKWQKERANMASLAATAMGVPERGEAR